jgi:predicted nucleic acid-binding protein
VSRTIKETIYTLAQGNCVSTHEITHIVFALSKARRIVEVEWDHEKKALVFKAVVPLPKNVKVGGAGPETGKPT